MVCLQEDGPLRKRYQAARVDVKSLPLRSLWGRGTLRKGFQLSRFLRNNRIDVLHAHDIYSNIFAVPFARAAGTPLVIASRRWWSARRDRKLRLANRLSYSLAHRVLANGPSVARLVVDEGVPAERVRIVPNFLEESAFVSLTDAERDALLAELGVPPQAMLIGSISNLRPIKDHATLLRAFALLPAASKSAPLHLILVGDGECRAALEADSRELGVQNRVHFAGYRTNDPNLHHLFDVSVISSISEASSNSILEAMAAGKPVVATETGGNPDAVVDGVTGLLVPVSAPQELANAISRLLESAGLRRKIGDSAQAFAKARHRPSAALSQLEILYNECTSRVRE